MRYDLKDSKSSTGQGFTALTYFLELDWLGQRTTVPVAVSSDTTEALLGGQMLNGSRLTIDYHDRTVRIVGRAQ